AVWVGNTRPNAEGPNSIASVSRVDPVTMTITHTATLRHANQGDDPNLGIAKIVVGDGAVWVVGPGSTVVRIDPRSGRVVKTIPANAEALAAGPEGVWALFDDGVARIDPATNRLGAKIPVTLGNAGDIAVGGGAVWVTDFPEGLLWRVGLGRDRTPHPIDVGV